MNITLQDCPAALRDAVEREMKSLSCFGEVLTLAVSRHESHIYKDKSVTTKTHRVTLMAANAFIILRHTENGGSVLPPYISKDSLNIGEVMEIFEAAPSWAGFADCHARARE